MSFDALAWAGKCKPGSAPRKLVLLALADRHNPESNISYPSVAWLAEWTGLNRKTIITALGDLETQKLISDSGQRVGKTAQVKAYTLHIGTVPKTEQSQKRNSPVYSSKQSQKRDTEPVKEPVKALPIARAKPVDEYPKPQWADPVVWADFLKNRKKKNKPNTATAYKRFCDDIARISSDEWPPGRLLAHAASEGWAGIYEPRELQNGQSRNDQSGMGVTERAARQAMHEIAGGVGRFDDCREQIPPGNGGGNRRTIDTMPDTMRAIGYAGG
jgi:Helix-turn-helix domain